jgi:hypothetical protein
MRRVQIKRKRAETAPKPPPAKPPADKATTKAK